MEHVKVDFRALMPLLLVLAVMACQQAPAVEPGRGETAGVETTVAPTATESPRDDLRPRPTGSPSAAPARSPGVETTVAPLATESPRDDPGLGPEAEAAAEVSAVASPPPTGSPSAAPTRLSGGDGTPSRVIPEESVTACHPERGYYVWTWDVFVEWSPDGGEVFFS